IGGKGQGPGEFEQPTDIYIDKNIYIMESFNRKLHIYDNNGNFIETIKFTNYVNYLSEKTEGYFIAKITSYKKEGRFIEIVLMNSNGKISKVIASFPFPIRVIRKKGVVFGTVNPYEPYIYFSPLKSGKGIYGYSLNYKLFVINAEGKIEFIIEKGESPVPITKKEKNKIIMDKYLSLQDLLRKSKRKGIELSRRDIKRLLFFPKHRPFYRKILSDELDNIYVKRIESVLKKQKFITFDFFNSKGIYLYEIKTSEEPDIIKNGYLYNYIQDDMGYIKIKRYKIKNWEKIRNYSSFLPKSYK
ncbi:6-bladed beta-propeller, partial [SCandidatus Aminicenantes bacterium Aminicenantia_JdfR_composite]|nr:6-bladed beta-propeller [SCandidatus Aminicenantes bacterium Aminicenantia_JdfR_composite]